MLEHLRLVLDGRVSPLLLWEKHPVVAGGHGLPGARSCCCMMKRLLFGTRPKIVVQQPGGRGGRR